MSHNKNKIKHEKEQNNDKNTAQGGYSEFDKIFQKSGLSTGAVAADTINFILNEQQEKNKKKAQDGHNFQMNQLLRKSNIADKPKEITRNKSNLQFMSYHGPQVLVKDKEKKWNTGTRDTANLFAPKSNLDAEHEMTDYDLQKAVNQQRKMKSSKKSMNAKSVLGNEYGANQEVAQAMRERERKEALELERMLEDELAGGDQKQDSIDHDVEADVFAQEVRIMEERRADQLRQERRFLELDQLEKLKQEADIQRLQERWKDTGYEDDILRAYKNPLERQKTASHNATARQRQQEATASRASKTQGVGKNIKETMQIIQENQKQAKRYEKQQQSLFQKSNIAQTGSYLTLDGSIKFDHNGPPVSSGVKTPLEASYTSLQEQRMAAAAHRNRVDQYKNKIISQSRFFILKQQSNLPIIAQNESGFLPGSKNSGLQIYKAGGQNIQLLPQQDLYEASYTSNSRKKNMRSQNLSPFALQSQNAQPRIPDVKEWFEGLELSDRLLAVTTIDNEISKELKQMHQKVKKSMNGEFGKFRMVTSMPSPLSSMIITNSQSGSKKDQEPAEKVSSKKPGRMMQLANSSSHRSSKEVEDAEQELLQYVRFTDTNEMHDTVTVTEDLVRVSQKFYQLAEAIVGTNYLKQPHEIRWLEEDERPQFEFESSAPLWLDMHQPNSIAAWILYYIERALFIQYQAHVKGQFQNCRDQFKQPIFINTDGRNIMIKDEIKPFWRNFCEDAKKDDNNVAELLELIRKKAVEEFKINQKEEQKNVDAFHGGLTIHSQQGNEKSLLVRKIEEFLKGVEEAARNFVDTPSNAKADSKQLNLKEVCMNTLQESSSLANPVNIEQIGEQFCFSASMSKASHTTTANDSWKSPESHHVDMRLERILIEQFRFIVTSKLKSHFTTANRRLQKKKIKKLKQKEQEKERERQLEEEKKREQEEKKNQKDKKEGGITVNSVNAIELLIGTSTLTKVDEVKPARVEEPTPPKQQVAKGGKKKRKGKKMAEQEEVKQEPPENVKDSVVDNKLNDISIASLPVKSSTPKEQQKNQPQTSKKVDPQNYFQVFGHKYAASLESQGGSNVGSDISKTTPPNKGLESSQRDSRGGTIRTLSTNEESKKTRQDKKELAEQAMSNQEVLNLFKQSSMSSQGNSHINRKSWQRRAHGAGEMINELLSEASSPHDEIQYANDVQIRPKIDGNYLLPELDDSGSVHSHTSDIKIPSAGNSSHSSVKENNRILKITKTQNRKVIPRRQVQSSESEASSSDDPDQDLLPDIYTTIRPEDNDSSDYGLEAGQEEDESVDDDSSVALSKNQNSQTETSPQQLQKSRSRRQRQNLKTKFRSANSKKTIKSANPKAVEPIEKNGRQTVFNKKPKIINFYPKGGYEEEEELEEPQLISESERIIHRWTKLKPNPPLTCVYITMSRELVTEGQVKKKQGKTKAQRKAEWKKYQDVSEGVQPKQIEIIKPDESATKALRAAPAQPTLSKAPSQTTSQRGTESKPNVSGAKNDKKNKKKNPTNNNAASTTHTQAAKVNPISTPSASAEAMNQFMMKMHGTQHFEQDRADKRNLNEQAPALADKQSSAYNQSSRESQSKDQSKGESSMSEKQGKAQVEFHKKKEASQQPKYSQTKARQAGQNTATEYAKKHQPAHKADASHQTAERLSMMEEAKILKDGYHYQVKKPHAENKDKTSKQEKEESKQSAYSESNKEKQNASKSAPLKQDSNKVEKSGLSIESKEYQVTHKTKKTEDMKTVSSLSEAIEGPSEASAEQVPNPEPKKKTKKKASRSNKARKKHSQGSQNQIQNMKFDQMPGQPTLMDFVMGQQAQGGFEGDQIGNTFLSGQNNQQFGFNKQVQDFIYQLNQQVMVQQQAQLQEMQLREQEEAETQMQEECEPCEETNPIRCDQFFELLEEEMENKVKEIDQLKDSVRKERQGFISIIETIVKDTFSNRYGNGYVGIKTFGSMATELAIETSDVDLVVTGIDSFQSSYNYGREYSGKNQLLRMMQKLYDNLCYLKDKGVIYKIKFIQGANVPIIKLVADLQMINKSQIEKAIERINQERDEESEETGVQQEERKRRSVDLSELGLEAKDIEPTMRHLHVDISIDEQSHQYLKYDSQGYGDTPRNHSGIDTIYHIQDLVRNRKDLRPIVMIMKKIFDATFLSMPYYGGISSYSLVLMVSAYLKAYDADKEASISRNLSSFFHFYGSQFKPHMYYLNGDDIVFCEDPSQRPFQDPFIVLDPLAPTNNISHSTFRIKDIQRALVKAFKIINLSCEQYQQLVDSDPITKENEHCQPKQVLERLITEIKQEYFSPNQYLEE